MGPLSGRADHRIWTVCRCSGAAAVENVKVSVCHIFIKTTALLNQKYLGTASILSHRDAMWALPCKCMAALTPYICMAAHIICIKFETVLIFNMILFMINLCMFWLIENLRTSGIHLLIGQAIKPCAFVLKTNDQGFKSPFRAKNLWWHLSLYCIRRINSTQKWFISRLIRRWATCDCYSLNFPARLCQCAIPLLSNEWFAILCWSCCILMCL